MPLLFALLIFLIGLAPNSYSEDSHSLTPNNLSSTKDADMNKLEEMASSRQWLDLLHYHSVGLIGDAGSQVDDPDFFLSSEGATNPLAELMASIEALESSSNAQVAQCRFPARFEWIQNQLNSKQFPQHSCPEFEKWRDEIAADGLTLIFPAAYLNSPSSMFGHTLMRIDSKKHKSELLSYSINYAANADPNDNELVFSYKGLTGGYPGVFSVLPYYEKVKEYNYLESRDVWEYKLDIDDAELERFIAHVWEVKDAHFDYYFFTENCSYHLLTLLDASSDRFELSKAFSTNVIPADTVRVLNEQGLITEAKFRPSMQTTLKHRMRSTDTQTELVAVQLVDQLDVEPTEIMLDSDLPAINQAQAYELAVSLARYRAKQDKDNAQAYNRRSIKLLSARSKLGDQSSFQAVPIPTIRDDEGHRSHRWLMRAGHDVNGNYLGADLRMSYHDFLDPVAGYIPGAQLEIIHFKFKAYERRAELEAFRAIDIASLSPRDSFIKPVSWFVSTGLERNIHQIDELMPYLKAGPGLTFPLTPSSESSALVSLMLSSRSYVDSDLQKGFTFESGPKIQVSLQNSHLSLQTYWERHYRLSGARLEHQTAFIGVGLPVHRNLGLRLGATYQEAKRDNGTHIYDTAGEFAVAWYF